MKRATFILMASLALLLASCGSSADTEATSGSIESNTEAPEISTEGDDGSDGEAEASDGSGQGNDTAGGESTNDTADSDTANGESTDGDTANGESTDSESTDGDTADSDTADSDTADSDTADGESTDDSTEGGTLRSPVLSSTLDSIAELGSARFESRIEVSGSLDQSTSGTFTIGFEGAYDEAKDATQLTMDLSDVLTATLEANPEAAAGAGLFAGFYEEPIEVISIGDQAWIKWSLLSLLGAGGDKWLETAAEESDELAADVGFSSGTPNEVLDALADLDADATVEVVGEEDINGFATTHHRALLDMNSLATELSAEELSELEARLGAPPEGNYTIDLWVGDDDLLHRFSLRGTNLLAEDGGEIESISMVYDISEHGADIDIEPPPADQIVSEDELGGDLGDLGGLGET